MAIIYEKLDILKFLSGILAFPMLLLSACGESPAGAVGGELPAAAHPEGPYLVVLGVAQDAGHPQAGCEKDCCLPVWERQAEGHLVSCLGLVDPANGRAWMLDATPDFREQLRVLQADHDSRLAGIFLTHAHIGHYTGLMHLGHEAMGASAVPVYAMPRMTAFLRSNGPWSQLVDYENIALRPLRNDSILRLSPEIGITPIKVPHRDEFSETVGYRIEGPAQSALFIPDIDKWERWERDISREIARVDYALLDGTFFANGEIPGRDMSQIPHPFIEESLDRFSALPPAERPKIHFIHFNHTNPVLQAGGNARSTIRSAGMRVARQGMILEL